MSFSEADPCESVKRNNCRMDMKQITLNLLTKIRSGAPLIHNITNYVVMNSTANILLATGAAPVMAHCLSEVEEMTAMAGALVLNIGTLQEDWVESMIVAARKANTKGIPVILDPVGAGATALRTAAVRKILSQADISVVRGNASEILSLASDGIVTKGVDSSVELSGQVAAAARHLAADNKCIIAISGPQDCVTDGRRIYTIANGHPLMARVTGTGCGLSAVTAAFCAMARDELLQATAAAFGFYGLCGELAAVISDKPGSFFVAFLDSLYATGEKEINRLLKINCA
jgi:hydroxyethylthiazole kinase